MRHRYAGKMLAVVLAAMCVCAAVPVQAAEMPEEEMAGQELIAEESFAEETFAAEAPETVPAVETGPVMPEPAAAETEPVMPEQAAAEAEPVMPEQAAAETESVMPEQTAAETEPVMPKLTAAEEEQNIPEETAAEEEEDAEEAEDAEVVETLVRETEEGEEEEEAAPSVSYCTHVQKDGWQDWVKDGEMSGTSGRSLRLEGIKIQLSGAEGSGIEYRTHVQKDGWQDWVSNGAMAGTEGRSLRLEAIQIRLTGEAASEYDIYYCTHVQTFGWLNWAKNGDMSGTAGYAKRLEGIYIRIVKKGDPAPEPLSDNLGTFFDKDGGSSVGPNDYLVVYNTHVQTFGWQDWVGDGAPGGTTGLGKRLEAMHILLQNQPAEGSIEYRTHVQKDGWQDWVKDGAMSGTSGQSKRLEAIQIQLTGEMAELYDVWYRTHVQSFGWLDWAKNGDMAGTEGYAYRMESFEIQLLPKGSPAPGSTDTPYKKGTIRDRYPLAAARLDQTGWDLRNAFIWSASMPYYRLVEDASYGARYFATFGFQNQKGDCYVMAACFYEMAKALGYDAHWMTGLTPLAAGGLGIHSWVEIDYNGTTYVCDPDSAHEGYSAYMVTYWTAPWAYYNRTRQN